MTGLTFDAAKHEDRAGGERLPSVSQILNSALGLRHYGDEVAMIRGTAVHDFIAAHFEDDAEPPEGIASYVESFRAFRDMLGLEPLLLEVRLHSPTLRYAGTVDCVARSKDGALWIIDWKSGALSPWHLLQVAAYNMLIQGAALAGENETLEAYADELLAANVAAVSLKAKLPRPVLVDDRAARVFRAAAAVYRWKEENNGSD